MSTITGTPLAENLASEVKEDFGRGFKSSEDRNCNVGSRVKVAEKQKKEKQQIHCSFYIAGPPMGSDVAPWSFDLLISLKPLRSVAVEKKLY